MHVRMIRGCIRSCGCGMAWIRELILQIQDEQIAGMQAQSGGDAAVGGDVAVASAACVLGIADGEIDFEDAVLAEEVGWFRYRAAFCGARTHLPRRPPRAPAPRDTRAAGQNTPG